MNVIGRFKEEHKNIVALISELWHEVREIECTEQGVVDCECMRIFVKLRDAITQYSDIEERFFFPALEEFVEIRALINDAYRAHKRISELVEKMEKLRLTKQCDRFPLVLHEIATAPNLVVVTFPLSPRALPVPLSAFV